MRTLARVYTSSGIERTFIVESNSTVEAALKASELFSKRSNKGGLDIGHITSVKLVKIEQTES